MTEPDDINVDELRRRARRRLIGAIVLALGAAVIVPMLLESDPKPLGDDVSVKIPPVDDSKFVNRLNGPQPKSEPPAVAAKEAPKEPVKEPVAPPESPARKSINDAEKAVVSPPGKTSKYDTTIAADKSPPSEAIAPPPPAPTATV